MTPDYTEMCPEDCRDLWIAVLRLSLEDYWRGIRKHQHRKLYVIRVRHNGRSDQEDFQAWLSAAHWLLSKDTSKRSFLWLAQQLRLDPDDVYSRMKNPPERRIHRECNVAAEKRALKVPTNA